MKNFIETITKMYKEKYSTILNKIYSEDIPVAFFSLEPIQQSIEKAIELSKTKNINITTLITISKQNNSNNKNNNFKIIHLNDIYSYLNKFKYIIVLNKLECSYLQMPEIKHIPILVLSRNIEKTSNIYDLYMNHLNDLFEVYNWLQDKESKKTFLGFILAKTTSNINLAIYAKTPQYICEGFIPETNSIVIDGGACDGSTSARFADMGYNVYGFEIDKQNFELALKLSKEKNFHIENIGLGSYKHKAKYIHNEEYMGRCKVDEFGNETISITTLDAYVRENHIPKVDFIKLDTEGSELDILKGSATVIMRWKPILAISAYHKTEDLWILAQFIKSIRKDYTFSMRHYPTSSEDLPLGFTESLENDLYYFKGDAKIITFGECILFAK